MRGWCLEGRVLYLDHVTSPSASLRDPHMLAEAGWGGGKGLAGVLLLLLVEKFYATLKSLLCGSIVRICCAQRI